MSSIAISGLGGYLESVLGTALQKTGLSTGSGSNTSNVNSSTISSQTDNSQLSPFAQLVSTLQQLQQSDPAKYQQVTQQIATNLQSAAQTATKDGNTAAASQLTQLATDFTNASQSDQLPNIQDLAQAIGGGHHHHHHHAQAASSDPDSNSSSSASTTSTSTNPLLAAFQSTGSQNDSTNAMSIIMNTLSSAGIGSSNS